MSLNAPTAMVPTGARSERQRIVLTRPAMRAQRWAIALERAGFATLSLPLLEVVAAPVSAALTAARNDPAQWQALVFVSGNAVRFFLRDVDIAALAAGTVRAWAPGPATAHALQVCGWPAARIDLPDARAGQFDSEALWARVAGQVRAGVGVLIVRGGDAAGRVTGRQWLAEQIRAAGGAVEQIAAYRRQAPSWTPQQREAALQARDEGAVWLFSSAEAVAHLPALTGVNLWGGARAVATHPRIAAAAAALGFDVLATARPHPRDVAAALSGTFGSRRGHDGNG